MDLELEADKARAAKLRRVLQKMEASAAEKRVELHALEKSIFQRCSHEWVKDEVDGTEVGLWYSYCPYVCKHCGFFKCGPIKF
jgi:hypothetical protein